MVGYQKQKSMHKDTGCLPLCREIVEKNKEIWARVTHQRAPPLFRLAAHPRPMAMLPSLRHLLHWTPAPKKGHEEEIGNLTGWINAQASEESQKMGSGNGILGIDLLISLWIWLDGSHSIRNLCHSNPKTCTGLYIISQWFSYLQLTLDHGSFFDILPTTPDSGFRLIHLR